VAAVRIGVLGATGPAGSGLAARLALNGYDVVLGSRSKYRAMEARDLLLERWEGHNLPIEASDNLGAAAADVVVIATPWDAATSTALQVGDQLKGKVVISMCNALAKVGLEFQPLVPPRGSVAANIQAAVPKARVAAAFHHVPAKELGDLHEPVESDVLVCSDHRSATDTATEIVNQLPALRALDAGQLSNAAPIEAFAAVLLQLNIRYKTRAAVKFTGIK
jgi:8-hydroxy-5-deazaflavin:NADPH oxidoreductase